MKTAFIIDVYNAAYRYAYVHRDLSFDGQPTGVVYGFMGELIRLHKGAVNPSFYMAWEGHSERRLRESSQAVEAGLIPTEHGCYKANRRREASDEKNAERQVMLSQLETVHELVKHMLVTQVTSPGNEADDIIGTLTKRLLSEGSTVFIVSTDKDFYQLLQPGVTLLRSNNKVMTYSTFVREHGYEPSLWVDAGALMGDKGDNILGVTGIGEKTADKLVQTYGTVDKIMVGLAQQETRKKTEQRVLDSHALVKLARSLKSIDLDVPLVEEHGVPDEQALHVAFTKLGFSSLLPEVRSLVVAEKNG